MIRKIELVAENTKLKRELAATLELLLSIDSDKYMQVLYRKLLSEYPYLGTYEQECGIAEKEHMALAEYIGFKRESKELTAFNKKYKKFVKEKKC